jgi:pimeloyl-ACP methyl ester carboxylesterase
MPAMHALAYVLAALVTALGPVPGAARAEAAPGVVFVVGGIGGLDPLGMSAKVALPLAGVKHEIREFCWTHGKLKLLRDLQDTRYLLARAGEMAVEVQKVKADHPERPVYLVGHSAGAAVVLAAAEQLPVGTLQRLIVLSAAVSPAFDLRPALRATRGELVAFNSGCDWVVLGWGTNQFGTADRVYSPSAGMVGFETPLGLEDEGRALYRRLVQRPWRMDMLLAGCGGAHHSTTMPLFLARFVAPWLRDETPPSAEPRP